MMTKARTPLKTLLSALLILAAVVAAAQEITGRVSDAISLEPLPGATIQVLNSEKAGIAGDNGLYRIENMQPGRYSLKVSYLGYETKLIPDVWVKNGKITTQDISMKRSYTGLDEVVIQDKINPVEIGRVSITEEQLNRFAATYYDPARVLTTSPDLVITNDQNNRVSVRGISPNYNIWRLEGVEIVNPNHLTNAGTFTDQSIATGGSVNIISAQMLGSSSFLYGGFQNKYGNTTGGLFDLNLREGNSKERQYTAQASLIGLDFSAEGPFSKSSDASYLLNYRYSFTGLLTHIGVDFGGEAISFQDLSLNVNIPMKNNSDLQIFAVGGLNFNNFNAQLPEDSELQKDRSDIYFDGKMGAMGASFKHDMGNGHAVHSLAVSSNKDTRDQNIYEAINNTNTLDSVFNTARNNFLLSYHSSFTHRIGKGSLNYGGMINYYGYEHLQKTAKIPGSTPQPSVDPDINSFSRNQLLFNPYLNFSYAILPRLEADAGLGYYATIGGEESFDPRLGLTWSVTSTTAIYAKAGYYSQLLNPYNYYYVYLFQGGDYIANRPTYGFQRSQRFNLGVEQNWADWTIGLESFYYNFPEVNIYDSIPDQTSASTRGISLVANRNYLKGWYFTAGGSLFNSTWNYQGEEYDNRFNILYNLSFSAGKEWEFTKDDKQRALSVNTKIMHQGGLREPYYQAPLNPETGNIVSTANNPFFRLDLRIQWTWYHPKRTSSVSLDIQNATAYRNEAFTYYDTYIKQAKTQYQLGLLPILTYRVEF